MIGINPFVFVPEEILQQLFVDAGKNKAHIPVSGTVNRRSYIQTLVKFKGAWRLYINTIMLPDSPRRTGEVLQLSIQVDSSDRTITPHPALLAELEKNKRAQKKFAQLSPSLQKEITRYIASLKTDASIQRNVKRAIGFLLGKNSFVGITGLR